MKKITLRLLTLVVVLVVLIQLFPVNRKNPRVTRDMAAPPKIAAILRTSCYDCHSNETRWPLYSHIAPVSWLVAGDVKKGRAMMNFSRWNAYSKAQRDAYPGRIYAMVSNGLMPPANYLALHRDARLDSVKIEKLRVWSEARPAERSPDAGYFPFSNSHAGARCIAQACMKSSPARTVSPLPAKARPGYNTLVDRAQERE